MAAAAPSTHLVNEEELKEMQKQKDDFDSRKGSLDDRHNFILRILESVFKMKFEVLEDLLCELHQLLAMESFFNANQEEKLFAFKIKLPIFKKLNKKIGYKFIKKYEDDIVLFHSGAIPYKGDAMVFLKADVTVPISDRNIYQDIFSFTLEGTRTLLGSYASIIQNIFLTFIWEQNTELGDLDLDSKKNYVNYIQDFNHHLETASICVDEKVVLDMEGHTVSMSGMDALTSAANDPESVAVAEESASRWMKQIHKEITEIELLRVESGIIGPHEEFKFWKKQMTRFNCLVNQLKLRTVTNTLIILKLAHSKVLDKWIEHDQKVTRAFIESKENTKFLSVIEKYSIPLYHRNIEQMIGVMPKLLQSLGMVYVYSTYYRTFTNMTQLFVKITNQMIQTCKAFITDKNKFSIWESDPDMIIKRMEICINLNNVYQKCYQKVRKEMKTDNESRYFDFSEVQIFGNFNLFERRLKKLIDILTSMKNYSIIKDVVLEGKEPILTKYDRITHSITTKKYDFLNQRNLAFDKDHEDFQNQIEDLHVKFLFDFKVD